MEDKKLGRAGRHYKLTEKGRNAFGYIGRLSDAGVITWEDDKPKLDILKLMEVLEKAELYDSSKQRKKLCTLSGVCEYRTDDGCDKDGFCNFQMEK